MGREGEGERGGGGGGDGANQARAGAACSCLSTLDSGLSTSHDPSCSLLVWGE